MKTQRLDRWAYAALLALAGIVALLVSWTPPCREIDNYAYDFFFRLHTPQAWRTESIILGVDEPTLRQFGGITGIRAALARGLDLVAPAEPKAVAIDVILADPGAADEALEAAFRKFPNLVLSSDLLPGGIWDDPIPRFRRLAAAIGQVHAGLDRYDAVNREIPLEKVGGRDRRWALALEAYRVSRGAQITESPDALEVGNLRIPSSQADGRAMRVRYVPPANGGVPGYSVAQLEQNDRLIENYRGKVVFAGLTAQTAVRDRWMTPYSGGIYMPGVEINANAFETIAQKLFLTDAPDSLVTFCCALLVGAAAAIFAFTSGWRANVLALALLVIAHIGPYLAFTRGTVFPYMPGVLCAWLAVVSAAAWMHLMTRRRLVRAEASQDRYRRAMQFVTHEMRTPLTAIQGSSELISRYALPEEKRKQIADMINSESKRMARMIETFLSVERLSGGEIGVKNERFHAATLVEQCVTRARPLADRKKIEIVAESIPDADLRGDKELMEYAVYNLLTNAVKYSQPATRVTLSGARARNEVRLWVQDQGMGMEKHEVRRIFDRFYRTNTAEQSGEAGSGIGLSIVEQIITEHGGSIVVESAPGRGSRFTLVLPIAAS